MPKTHNIFLQRKKSVLTLGRFDNKMIKSNIFRRKIMKIDKNFGFSRGSGILMPVSSLPSRYGIGSCGKEAFKFVDFLSDCGVKVWQVLPLNPTSYGDSPYQSPSVMAGNPYFVDLDLLREDGLLTPSELKEAKHDTKAIDYGWLFENRYKTLRIAYSRFVTGLKYFEFAEKNAYWLDDYALYMALKVKNDFKAFSEWKDDEKDVEKAKQNIKEHKKEIGFWKFVQYEFFKQWGAVLDYAHERGVSILGDLPIYVAYDSVDVWSNPKNYLLDEDLVPKLVAGVPPDAFSDDGQLWGNPIYDWDKMKKDGFEWWTSRIRHAKELYDIIRIDHFRGFAGYFTIPNGDKTARNGWWNKGVGEELFEAVRKNVRSTKIIAEDLGIITPDVRELLKSTGYPGMKVLQFGFSSVENEYLPHNYRSANCIVYTGTHDNATTREWASELKGRELSVFKKVCPRAKGQSRVDALISLAMNSKAALAVIPIADYLNLGADARINRPSEPMGNWTWRMSAEAVDQDLKNRVRSFVEKAGR